MLIAIRILIAAVLLCGMTAYGYGAPGGQLSQDGLAMMALGIVLIALGAWNDNEPPDRECMA